MKTIVVNVKKRGSSYPRQIITGLSMLKKDGVLDFEIREKSELEKMIGCDVEIIVDDIRIMYDLSDGYNNYHSFEEFDNVLDNFDICFKASFKEEFHKGFLNRNKIHVLAPRYAATIAGSWNEKIIFSKTKGFNLAKQLLWKIPGTKHAIRDYHYECFECEPYVKNEKTKLFFYTRLWNPAIASGYSSQNQELDGKTVEERIEKKSQEYYELSGLRADLVKKLKLEFGDRFIGGIAPDNYARRNYPELLGPDLSQRRKYTAAMHSAEICVNTWGTHKCYNFSFGEELAGARAIVTQNPFYKIPDYLEKGKNFLTYNTVDECVEILTRFMDDKATVEAMMQENRDYYLTHLRPDRYVIDTLKVAGVWDE